MKKPDKKKVKVVLYGRVKGPDTCSHCVDEDKYWKRRKVDYRFVNVDSKRGKTFASKNKIVDLPAARICTTKEGKTSCVVHVGTYRKPRKITSKKQK
jgi:glutaredoxin